MLLENLFRRRNAEQDPLVITARRDSVCAGDDCLAPHETQLTFHSSATLTDLLQKAAEYVPAYDTDWVVKCGGQVIGRLISGESRDYQIKPEGPNIKLSALPEKSIFCRMAH